MKKKFAAFFLLIVFLFALASCDPNEDKGGFNGEDTPIIDV